MSTTATCSVRHNGDMDALKDTLHQDLTAAMRAGDTDTVRTLRMVLTNLTNAEVAGKAAHTLSADEELALLTGELKRRREAAEAFTAAGRTELAEQEDAEAAVIERYLPQPLSAAEIEELVSAAVARAEAQGLSGGRAMGAVMKDLKAPTAGRVDGAALAAQVKRSLAIG